MRVSVCNWSTSKEDVERTVKAFADVLQQLRAQDCNRSAVIEVDVALERS
jgi:hypothetical protein